MLLLGRALIIAALAGTVGSTLRAYPHQLAYFNESAGGAANGRNHLLGSSLDWGQDLVLLKRSLRSDPSLPREMMLSTSYLNPQDLGVTFTLPRLGRNDPRRTRRAIVSVAFLSGLDAPVHAENQQGFRYLRSEQLGEGVTIVSMVTPVYSLIELE